MTDELELLKRLADYVRVAVEDGAILPGSPVGTAWRDYAERYRWQSVTDEVQAVFSAAGSNLVPKAALHKVQKNRRGALESRAAQCREYISQGVAVEYFEGKLTGLLVALDMEPPQ